MIALRAFSVSICAKTPNCDDASVSVMGFARSGGLFATSCIPKVSSIQIAKGSF